MLGQKKLRWSDWCMSGTYIIQVCMKLKLLKLHVKSEIEKPTEILYISLTDPKNFLKNKKIVSI